MRAAAAAKVKAEASGFGLVKMNLPAALERIARRDAVKPASQGRPHPTPG